MIFTSKPVRRVCYFPASPNESRNEIWWYINCLQVHFSVQKGLEWAEPYGCLLLHYLGLAWLDISTTSRSNWHLSHPEIVRFCLMFKVEVSFYTFSTFPYHSHKSNCNWTTITVHSARLRQNLKRSSFIVNLAYQNDYSWSCWRCYAGSM
jgi:hypothetical protein